MAKKKTEVDEATRIKKLREGTIKAMKKAVKEEPEKYDAERLDQAIEELNKVEDKNIDAYLILGKHLSILMKQVEFSEEEFKKLYDMLDKNFEIVKYQQCTRDNRTRDDYQFLLNTKKREKVIVWVNKMEPLFKDYKNGYYNILTCGCILSMVNRNYKTLDDMLVELKQLIEEYK